MDRIKGHACKLTSQLHLPATPALDDLLFLYGRGQRRAVGEAAHSAQYLRDPVVRKHGDLIDVPERPEPFSLEARPQVGDQDLRSLEETNGFPAPLPMELVPEAREILGQQVDEPRGGAVGRLYAVGEAACVFLPGAVRIGDAQGGKGR